MAEVYRRVARWWEESTRLPPISPGFESRRRWLWCWFPPLLHEVFLRVLRFFSLLKNQLFQTPTGCVKFLYFVGTLCASTVYQLLKLFGVTPVTLVFFVWWILQGVLTSDLKKKTYGKWKSFLRRNKTYLPFLMVFRPTKASSTGSMLSPIFSISTQSPFATARSMVSRYLSKKTQRA